MTRSRWICLAASAAVHALILLAINPHVRLPVDESVANPLPMMEIVVREIAEPAPLAPTVVSYEPMMMTPHVETAPIPELVMNVTSLPLPPPMITARPVPVHVESIPIPPNIESPVVTAPPLEDLPTASVAGPVPVTALEQRAVPNYLHNPAPDYPRIARERGWQGTTWLRVEVRSDGTAGSVKILRTSGYDLLDDLSVKTVRGWKFVPAVENNRAVTSWVEIPIRFALVNG